MTVAGFVGVVVDEDEDRFRCLATAPS